MKNTFVVYQMKKYTMQWNSNIYKTMLYIFDQEIYILY